jgi:uncharacterized membrane protein
MTGRRTYVDWARGLAVVLMIEAHTIDAWTRAASKSTVGFRYATMLGGFAAPAFLWLAGVSIALAATRLERRGSKAAAAASTIAQRGLEIFVLAFLFRLQSFIVSPGKHPISLFRVDILNVMGPSIAVAALMWSARASARVRVVMYASAAIILAMATPIVRASAGVDLLPAWIQWYVRPTADYTTFTLFPWAAFVFAGSACGLFVAASGEREERARHWLLAAAGVMVIALGWYASKQPSIYRTSSFWTTSPTWFAIRTGVLMVSLSALYAIAFALRRVGVDGQALARFGRASLFVYWIHVELVYGYATWPLHARLNFGGTLAAFGAFTVAMYWAVLLRDRIVERWRARTTAEIFTISSPSVR